MMMMMMMYVVVIINESTARRTNIIGLSDRPTITILGRKNRSKQQQRSK